MFRLFRSRNICAAGKAEMSKEKEEMKILSKEDVKLLYAMYAVKGISTHIPFAPLFFEQLFLQFSQDLQIL